MVLFYNKSSYGTDQDHTGKSAQLFLNSHPLILNYDQYHLNSFTKRQNFRPVKFQRLCRGQNKCDLFNKFCSGKSTKHCGKMEKMLVTCTFSFFHNVLQKTSLSGSLKVGIVWKRVKLP